MRYTVTNISMPPLRPWAPDDDHIDHVSKPDENRWKNDIDGPEMLWLWAQVVRVAHTVDEEYRRNQRKRRYELEEECRMHQRKRRYNLGVLFNGIRKFFRRFRDCREKTEVGSSR